MVVPNEEDEEDAEEIDTSDIDSTEPRIEDDTAQISDEEPIIIDDTVNEVTEPLATGKNETDNTITPVITGTPGMTVNCQQMLPCQWISDDSQFTVTVTNADNIGSQSRFVVNYAIQTSHDTSVYIASAEPTEDSDGVQFEPITLTLADGIGGTPRNIIAGDTLEASIQYSQFSGADSLANWTIGLSDSGICLLYTSPSPRDRG